MRTSSLVHKQRQKHTLTHAAHLVVRLLLGGPALEGLRLAVDQRTVAADLDVLLVGVIKLHTLRHRLGDHLWTTHTHIPLTERLLFSFIHFLNITAHYSTLLQGTSAQMSSASHDLQPFLSVSFFSISEFFR